MTSELDHLFIFTSIGAPTADRLLQFGLKEGTSNIHPGQGTANRRFFFHNAMLELLWVTDSAEVRSEKIAPTHLWERSLYATQNTCPFGLCFRSSKSGVGRLFSTWEYRPPYLPDSISIPVATNAALTTEPMLFYIPFGQRPDTLVGDRRQPLDHGVTLKEITRVAMVTPHAKPPSLELQAIMDVALIQVRPGPEYRLEVGFDDESQGKTVHFGPELPLTFSW